MSHQINVHAHPKQLGANANQHKRWTDFIRSALAGIIVDSELREIDFYNFDGRFQNLLSASDGARLVVLGNSSFKSREDQGTHVYQFEPFAPTTVLNPSDAGVLLKHTPNGPAIAEYIQDTNELNILFDLFAEFTDERAAILVGLFQQLQESVFKSKAARFSWKYTSNKSSLMSSLVTSIREGKERQLADDKHKCSQWENELASYRREMKTTFDKLIQRRNSIENEEKNLGNVEKQVASDLDAVASHPKVTDIQIKNGKYTIYTTPIHAVDVKGRRYYIGNCWFEINMAEADVRFFSDNPRQGFWSGNNYHPHVNSSGGACLGNVAATIAELSSQQQLYALVMVCIDYLESVNIADAAGRRVTSWDKVDEEGKVIAKGGTYKLEDTTLTCPACDEEVGTLYTVYEGVNMDADETGVITYTPHGEEQRCESCRDHRFYFHTEADVYVRS